MGGLALLVLVGIAICILALYRYRKWAHAETFWQATHRVDGDVTEVLVRKYLQNRQGAEKELGTQVVASIPSDAPDHHDRFEAAMQEAYHRAADYMNPPLEGTL
jgi:hypothetical protein